MILAGTLMIPTPLPGAVLIAAGLASLCRHYRGVRRLTISMQWRARRWRRRREAVAAEA